MKLLKPLIIFLCWVCVIQSQATHILGGEMSYEYLGGDRYRITLTMYRDCGPDNVNFTDFDDYATIGIFKDLELDKLLDIPFTKIEKLNLSFENPCLLMPPRSCVEKGTYIFEVELPYHPSGYVVSYQRCCRNSATINVVNAEDMGLTLWAFIPTTEKPEEANNSPVFDGLPPFVMCMNTTTSFPMSATDKDGDELKYEFYTPFHGADRFDPRPAEPTAPPYDTIVWEVDYSTKLQLLSDPPIYIDENTGMVTVTPTKAGKFAIGVKVNEYRDGELLSTSYLDFVTIVAECPTVEAIIDSITDGCLGMDVFMKGSSLDGEEFTWTFMDEGEMITKEGEEVSYTFKEPGRYRVKLHIVSSTGCEDTVDQYFDVYPLLAPELMDLDTFCIGDTIPEVVLHGAYEDYAQISWDLGPEATNRFHEGRKVENIFYPDMGIFNISVNVFQDVCEFKDSLKVHIHSPPDPKFSVPIDTGCAPFDMHLVDLSDGAQDYSYVWDMGNGEKRTELDSIYTYQDPGEFVVTVEVFNNAGCMKKRSYSRTKPVKVYEPLEVLFDNPAIQCLEGNVVDLAAYGNITSKAYVYWYMETGSVLGPLIDDTLKGVSFNEVGQHYVTVYGEEHNCEAEYTGVVEIQNNPEAAFDVLDELLCVDNVIHFSNSSTADTPLSYLWDFGVKDGYSRLEIPNFQYSKPGKVKINLTVWTTEGCIDTSNYIWVDTLDVLPLPDPNFKVNNPVLDITDKVTLMTNLSDSAIWGFYVVKPTLDSILGLEPFSYEFNPGISEVWQIVENRHGCIDSTKRIVTVINHTIYVPNAFTPNNDGINDGFRAHTKGLSQFHMIIADRWGNVVFETENQEQLWTGILPNGHLAKSDVYTYKIKVTEMLGYKYDYIGRVTLVR